MKPFGARMKFTGRRSRHRMGTQHRKPSKRKLPSMEELISKDFTEDVESYTFQISTVNKMTGEMKEILLDAQELVARWQQADPPKKQMWADRQTLLNETWGQSCAEILKFFLQSAFAVPDDAMCERCLNEVAVVKCHECSASQHFCCGCDNSIHGSVCAYPSNNIAKQLISFLSFTYLPICSCIFVSPQSNSLSF